MTKEDLQKKIMEYRMLEQNYQMLMARRDEILARVMEVRGTAESVEELEKSDGKEVFLPIGAGILVPAKFDKKKKMVIGIGSDIVAEKDIGDIKKELVKRLELFEKAAQGVDKELNSIQKKMVDLEPELMAKTKK